MTNLSREAQPSAGLEERIVSTLVAAGLVRRRRARAWWAIAAAAILVTLGATTLWLRRTPVVGQTYVVLLYEDSTYRPPLPGHDAERVAVIARWADSLAAVGKFEDAGRVRGSGPLGGLLIVRATDAADAARIEASCPFTRWGGHVEMKRFDR